jgi:hypothetical protein
MAKQMRDAPISSKDLIEFLDTSSDFAFELRCVEKLTQLGFHVEHGGSYTDRVTGKTRQFDIRALRTSSSLCVQLPVECKNLTVSFPLIAMCVPRAPNESFHELLVAFHPDMEEGEESEFPYGIRLPMPGFRPNCKTERVDHTQSGYAIGAPVSKAVAQVGRAKDKAITSTDGESFEKWSQALASAQDLADAAAE